MCWSLILLYVESICTGTLAWLWFEIIMQVLKFDPCRISQLAVKCVCHLFVNGQWYCVCVCVCVCVRAHARACVQYFIGCDCLG